MPAVLRVTYASRLSRLGGQMLDGLIVLGVFIVAVILSEVSEPLGKVGLWATLVFAIAYYLFADAMPRGQSFGKRVVNIACVDADTGTPCTVAQSIGRNLSLFLLGPIDWIFIFGERHQRLGDKLAGTIVIDAPARIVQ